MAAIVTTLKISHDKINPVYSFINYHLAIGFHHIYLFVDSEKDDDDNSLFLFDNFDQYVSIYYLSTMLRQNQKMICQLFLELERFLDNEVQSRQILNAEYAAILATKAGYNWLLHIDIDEIFYCSEGKLVSDHFQYLDSLNILTMTYINHEGVPESYDTDDYFTSVTLFRRHHFSLPLNRDTEECIEYWRKRRNHNQYLLAYDNGKSAVRLGEGKVIPVNVHKWKIIREEIELEGGNKDTSSSYSRTAIVDPRNLNYDNYLPMSNPCILHYVTCGISWLKMKYEILGKFSDFWYKGKVPIAPCFHLDARDAYWRSLLYGAENNNDNNSNNILLLQNHLTYSDTNSDNFSVIFTTLNTNTCDDSHNSTLTRYHPNTENQIDSLINKQPLTEALPPPLPSPSSLPTTTTTISTIKLENNKDELALHKLYINEVMFPLCNNETTSKEVVQVTQSIKLFDVSEGNRKINVVDNIDTTTTSSNTKDNIKCQHCLLLQKQLTSGVLFRTDLVRQAINSYRTNNSNNTNNKTSIISDSTTTTTSIQAQPPHSTSPFPSYGRNFDSYNNLQHSILSDEHPDIKCLNLEVEMKKKIESEQSSLITKQVNKSRNTVNISAHPNPVISDQSLEEMDKLRFISQAAINFL